jgi:nucleoid-associated protein YgaU
MRKILAMCFIIFLLVPISVFAEEKLSEKDAQDEIAMLQEQLAEAEAMIEGLEVEVDMLDAEVASLQSRRDDLQAKFAELNEIWKRCQYGRYTVVDGDWLCTIAAMRKVYNKCAKWPMIYEANKDKIKDPNLIYPGWVLLIPTLDHYSVIPGDCLSLIASYLSIYSNAKKWPEIYEANKDKIKDPDWIYPKQEFVIPHE